LIASVWGWRERVWRDPVRVGPISGGGTIKGDSCR
jgi:hypothetical protein